MKGNLWIGWVKGFPWRLSGYCRYSHAAALMIGPLCIQWRMPAKG